MVIIDEIILTCIDTIHIMSCIINIMVIMHNHNDIHNHNNNNINML